MNNTPILWAFELLGGTKFRFEHAHDYIIFVCCQQKSLMLRVGI